jgi:methionyl aminopeptidase
VDEEVREKYIEAGRITKKARETARELAEPGTELEEIARRAEQVIYDEGAKPAFPINLSLNEEAAHYTPSKEDDRVLSEGDVLKIDVGAHIDGYIGDTAVTVDLGEHDALVDAAARAVDAALEEVQAGTNLGRIGQAIQEAIEQDGFKPIRNLSGHSLERYTQHAGTSIPNIHINTQEELETGKAYAIEPFATTGEGKVTEGGPGNIYKYEGGNTRNKYGRKVLSQVKKEYKTLPFTSRWFDMSSARLKLAFRNLVQSEVLHEYDVLKETGGGLVSQKEHTVLVLEGETIVTTR